MTTYWVGQAMTFDLIFKHDHMGGSLPGFGDPQSYLAFRFYDKSRAALRAADTAPDVPTGYVKGRFVILPDFFTPARMGPCETQAVLLDGDDRNPAIAYPIEKAEVVGMIMSPTELTA